MGAAKKKDIQDTSSKLKVLNDQFLNLKSNHGLYRLRSPRKRASKLRPRGDG